MVINMLRWVMNKWIGTNRDWMKRKTGGVGFIIKRSLDKCENKNRKLLKNMENEMNVQIMNCV